MAIPYEAIIIGTGQAGPALADRLSRAGMKVAVVERSLVGGTCLNTGCTPTKTCDVRPSALYGAATRDAYPSHRFGTHSHAVAGP